jgi:hypothetical protein
MRPNLPDGLAQLARCLEAVGEEESAWAVRLEAEKATAQATS